MCVKGRETGKEREMECVCVCVCVFVCESGVNGDCV